MLSQHGAACRAINAWRQSDPSINPAPATECCSWVSPGRVCGGVGVDAVRGLKLTGRRSGWASGCTSLRPQSNVTTSNIWRLIRAASANGILHILSIQAKQLVYRSHATELCSSGSGCSCGCGTLQGPRTPASLGSMQHILSYTACLCDLLHGHAVRQLLSLEFFGGVRAIVQ